MQDFYTLFLIGGLLLYPLLVIFLTWWMTRPGAAASSSRPSTGVAIVKGLSVLLLPPVLLVLVLLLVSSWDFQGICSGWMDSGPRPCTLAELLLQNLFWICMVGFIPILTGLAGGLGVFLWRWMAAKKAQSKMAKNDASPTSTEDAPPK